MSSSKPLSASIQRVAAALQAQGHPHAPVMLSDAARTAQQAADALGVVVGQIAKSIIFRRLSDDAAVLVVTAGDQRVDEALVAALVGPLGRADAAFVKASTGYSIGGVPPIAHFKASVTLIDRTLFRFEDIWAAAGHPHAVFRLQPDDLVRLMGAPVADVVLAVAPERSPDAPLSAAASARPAGATGNIHSPCISVCRMNPVTQLCEGCYRTLGEIIYWGSADERTLRAIQALIERRRAAASAGQDLRSIQ